MKYLIIISILFLSCSKEEIKEESISTPQIVLNDLDGNYGTYKDLNSSQTIQVIYPNTFIYNGNSYNIETRSKYIYIVNDCDYQAMEYLRKDVWVLTYWNGYEHSLEVFSRID